MKFILLIFILVCTNSSARADYYDCTSALDDAEYSRSNLRSSIDDFESCMSYAYLTEDCESYFYDVEDDFDDYEDDVSDVKDYCEAFESVPDIESRMNSYF